MDWAVLCRLSEANAKPNTMARSHGVGDVDLSLRFMKFLLEEIKKPDGCVVSNTPN